MKNILGWIVAIPLLLGMMMGQALPYVILAMAFVFGLGVFVGTLI